MLYLILLIIVFLKKEKVIIFGVQKNENSTKEVRRFYSLMKEKASSDPLNSKTAFENLPKIYPSKLNSKHFIQLN